jgi:hypothetical protein
MTRLSPHSLALLLAAALTIPTLGASLARAEEPPAAKAPAAPAAAAADYGEKTSPEVQAALEGVLGQKVSKLLDEKNADGISYKRGVYSRRFRKVDSDTYQATLHMDTLKDDDTLLTERYLVTLKRDASKTTWKVASEDLQDSYNNLYRRAVDKTIHRFESFNLSREGLTLTGGRGMLFKSYRQGRVEAVTFVADGLSYQYTAPEKRNQMLFEKLKRDNAADILFKPEYVDIECDPASCEQLLATAFKGLGDADAKPTTEGSSITDSKLKSRFEESVRTARKNRRESPFGGYRRPASSDRRYYSLFIQKDNPDKAVGLSYDNWEQRQVNCYVYNLDKDFPSLAPVYNYYSAETIKSGANQYDLERRDDSDARDCDLVGLNGTVELGLEDPEMLKADVTFKLVTKRELREIPFFISRLRQTEAEKKEAKNPQMVVNSIEDADGNPLTWVKTAQAGGLVIFPKTLPANTPVTLHMNFTNSAAIYNFTSTFSYVDRFGWLPFVRFTDMIHDFKLTIKVPARKTTLGIGKKISDRVDGDVRITEWIADSPVEFPSVTYGEYMEADSKVEAKKTDGTKIPVRIHVDKSGIPVFTSAGGGVGIRMRDILPITPSGIQYLVDQAANSLNLFREIYGVDYPYGKLDLVNDPLGSFYGQSPSSLIYLGEGTFASQGIAGEVGGSNLSKFNREVVPHEVAHQWWGSLIPNANNGNYWFVESLAEYSSALFVEFESGKGDKDAYQDKVADWRRVLLNSDLQSSVQDASVVWSGHLGSGYQAAVYNKGPYAFHVMRMTWGDEKFFKFLKTLAQELKNKHVVTRDIQRVAEKTFGGNMDFFFDQWLRGVGNPEYTFNYSVRQTEDQKYMLEGTVDQRVLVGSKKDVLEGEYFTAIVPITVVGKSGKEYRIPLRIQGAKTPFQQKLPEAPKDITLNKYGESLAYDIIVNKIASN